MSTQWRFPDHLPLGQTVTFNCSVSSQEAAPHNGAPCLSMDLFRLGTYVLAFKKKKLPATYVRFTPIDAFYNHSPSPLNFALTSIV